MTVDALQAARAYADIARTAGAATGGAGGIGNAGTPQAPQADFGALLANAVDQATSTIRAGEAAGARVAAGDADVVDVATAISAAEVSLEAAIAVRNRVIEAYQEIMRMPI